MRPAALFIDALMDEVRRTERVLLYHASAPPFVSDLCLNAHVAAMHQVCARQSIAAEGVQELLRLSELFELHRRGHLSDAQAIQGTKIAGQYGEWLEGNFAVEVGPSCKWPPPERFTRKGDYPCEKCGKSHATVHLTTCHGPSLFHRGSIERHEFCKECVPVEYRNERER